LPGESGDSTESLEQIEGCALSTQERTNAAFQPENGNPCFDFVPIPKRGFHVDSGIEKMKNSLKSIRTGKDKWFMPRNNGLAPKILINDGISGHISITEIFLKSEP
jgi:hypothetical protein